MEIPEADLTSNDIIDDSNKMKRTKVSNIVQIDTLCRICLSSSENLLSMRDTLGDSPDNSTTMEYFTQILGDKVKIDPRYPEKVCRICFEQVKLAFDLQKIFLKSQSIIQRYIHLNSLVLPNKVLLFDSEDVQGQVPKYIPPDESNVAPGKSSQNKIIVDKVPNKPLLKCRYCHQRFSTSDLVKKHLEICKYSERYTCDYCSCQFERLSLKRYHIKTKHSNEIRKKVPAYQCEFCSEVFPSSRARSYHKITRHNRAKKTYCCEVCGRSFVIKGSFDQHMESHNKDVSKVICPVCGKSFHYRGGLFYHMKMHNNERNYVCSFCNRRFLNITALKRHTRTHTGERPYICSYCSKSFCSRTELKTHEWRHVGHKPYTCEYCGQGYFSLWSMKLHMSSHPGKHPCDHCNKCFLNSKVLKLHVQFKHKDELINSHKVPELEEETQSYEELISSGSTEILRTSMSSMAT